MSQAEHIIEPELQAQVFLQKHAEILEMIATGKSAAKIYDAIALMYEARHPGMRCSLLELKGNKLMHGGAPSLPEEYCNAVNGLVYGPDVGSCGTSTYTGKRVLVENIETDPKWAVIKHAALPHGMRCCWSEPIKNSSGKVLGAFGMYYDHPALPNEFELEDLESASRLAGIIMERDQREIALRKSEFKYRTLIENLPQRFFLKDTESRFISCSKNFADDLGISPEEIIGTTDADYYPQEIVEQHRSGDQKVIQTGVSEEFEETALIDGNEVAIHTVKAPAFDENGNIEGIIGIFWDVTEQKLLEEKFHQAQKMESMGTLVGGVAHEFNNTLAGITGSLFLAKSESGNNPGIHKRLDTMSKLCFRAADMVKQLLAFSRKSPVQFKPFELTSFIKETYKLHKYSIPESIRVDFEVSEVDLPVLGDTSQIQQIIINLLHNARDALSGTYLPHISLSLAHFEADDGFLVTHPDLKGRHFAHLKVEDNGDGISEEDINKVFDPFFTTKEVGKGTGLGLSMVYGAVQMHNGAIDLESDRDDGTCINIYIPLSSTPSQTTEQSEGRLAHGNDECILFVDDEAELRNLTAEVLQSLGYRVLQASNGTEAIDVYTANSTDIALIIMDIIMPEMGGVEAALAIRNMNEDVKVIFSTGYDGKDVIDECVLSWADLITKPFVIDEFSQLISKRLSN